MAGTKLTGHEIDERVDKCIELRYKGNNSIIQKQWIKYCHDHYGDKSEQQYCYYWSQATEQYNKMWRAKLDKMLDPAMNELITLLADEDPKIRQRAVDQIVKYTGNDIQKIEANIQGNVVLSWGNELIKEKE